MAVVMRLVVPLHPLCIGSWPYAHSQAVMLEPATHSPQLPARLLTEASLGAQQPVCLHHITPIQPS